MRRAAFPRPAAAVVPTAAALLAAVTLAAGCAYGVARATSHGSVTRLPVEEGSTPLASALPTASVAAAGVRVISRIPTTDRVVYVGIDDGLVRLPEVARMLGERRLPVSLFIIGGIAAQDPAYFSDLVRAGATVEDHTMDHPLLTRMSEAGQRREICDAADRAAVLFGRRPTLFRPPYGAYDSATLRAVHDCGMDTVVLWDVAVNDGVVQYQTGHALQPGDIVLMHFRGTGVADLSALLRAVDQAGLRIGSLEDAVAALPPPAALPVVPPVAPSTLRHTWHPVATPTVRPPALTASPVPTLTVTPSASAAPATAVPSATATPAASAASTASPVPTLTMAPSASGAPASATPAAPTTQTP